MFVIREILYAHPVVLCGAWYLSWMTSCTVGIPRSSWILALVTYHGASTVALSILDWRLYDCNIGLGSTSSQFNAIGPYRSVERFVQQERERT